MSTQLNSVLVQTALASRLVTAEQIHRAIVTACDGGDERSVAASEVSDDAIGRRLVELGFLNPWQVEQLKAGRAKFTLGPYRILDAIGRGGMGHVFKAEHQLLGRVEAIKVLPRSKTTSETIAKFHHEIRTQAQLDHPNLVRIHYADQEGDTYFFVTEFVPGTDLRRLVRRCGPLPAAAAALIVQQAAEGLEHAHRRGLVHRDIKPGNLLVTPGAVTKLIDLGLAWYLESDIQAAKEGDRLKIVGTADYLAPETIRSPGSIMPISDIYSLGCTLYYAVTGKVPFPGGNPADKMQRHLHELPLSPDQLQPNLPREFVELIGQMMAKDHHQRIPSAAIVAERLRQWASDEAILQIRHVVEDVETQQATELHIEAPRLDDTLTFEAEEDELPRREEGESPSQQSQGTDPISSTAAETSTSLPAPPPPPFSQTESSDRLGRWVIACVSIAILAAGALVGGLLWNFLK